VARRLDLQEALELVIRQKRLRVWRRDEPEDATRVDSGRWRNWIRILSDGARGRRPALRWLLRKVTICICTSRSRIRSILQNPSHFRRRILGKPLAPETHGQPTKIIVDRIHALAAAGSEGQAEQLGLDPLLQFF